MATDKELHELIGKAVVDEDFRRRMMADPEGAAKEAGIELTPEQAEALKTVDGQGLAEVLEERLPKSLGIKVA